MPTNKSTDWVTLVLTRDEAKALRDLVGPSEPTGLNIAVYNKLVLSVGKGNNE